MEGQESLIGRPESLESLENNNEEAVFHYERIEHCLRCFMDLCASKPPHSFMWFFIDQETGTSFTIQKQTVKNKCPYKAMMVHVEIIQLPPEYEGDGRIRLQAVETHMRSYDEALDCFKEKIWPRRQTMRFMYFCTYKRRRLREPFEVLVRKMEGLLGPI